MFVVRVPEEWQAALVEPLRARGGHLGDAATVVLAPVPPGPGERWLALCRDDFAVAAALDVGADDAVRADAAPELVAARLARLARGAMLTVGELTLDPLTRTARRAGRPLALLPREYAVLAALARHAGTTVSRATLNAAVWGRGFDPGTNVIEVHVSRVRAALDRGRWPMLLTERGRGYRLVAHPVAEAARAS